MIVTVKTQVPVEHLTQSGKESGLGGTVLEEFTEKPLDLELELQVNDDGSVGSVKAVNGSPVLVIG